MWRQKELKHYVRRKRKLPRNLKSPFISRVVSLSSNVISIEKDFCDSIFVSTRDYDDVIWENDDGESMTQEFVFYFQKNMFIHSIIIDCWSSLLNSMEEYKSESTLSRLFFNTNMMPQNLMNERELQLNRMMIFETHLKLYIGNHDFKSNFTNIRLVFFPILDDEKYHLLCFNLKKASYYIIDHIKREGPIESIYGKIPTLVQRFFCNYLRNENHTKGEALWIMEPQMMKMAWQVADVSADCGLYLMRHMECYMGEGEGKWESGFSGVKQHDEKSLHRLQYKYMYKLLNFDYNMHKDKLTPESKVFSKLDLDKKKEKEMFDAARDRNSANKKRQKVEVADVF